MTGAKAAVIQDTIIKRKINSTTEKARKRLTVAAENKKQEQARLNDVIFFIIIL